VTAGGLFFVQRVRKPAIASIVALVLVAAACGSSSSKASNTTAGAGGEATTTAAPTLKGTINVLAASSLTNAFTALGKDFESAYPGTSVKFSFGSSATLVTQIRNGAPADVFASADQANMDKVVKAGDNAGTPQNIAKNKLEIAVAPGNPKQITSVADLAKPGIVVVLCDPSVPCGKFANQVLANAKVTVTPKSREINVKATLSKVTLGEADAAIVYVSDVKSAGGKVEGVTIPDSINVLTTLPIVALKGSSHSDVATAWNNYVVAHQQELVSQFGFLPL
jgi:molybdate transport system substrate-binding protein